MRRTLGWTATIAVLLYALVACGPEPAGGGVPSGRVAFQNHCGSCHQLPSPEDLTYAIWDTVILPRMRDFMVEAGVDPGNPAWAELRTYVLQHAPDHFTSTPMTIRADTGFHPRFPDVFLSPPSGTYLSIPPAGGVVVADLNKQALLLFDQRLEPVRSLQVGRGITDMQTVGADAYATVIGSFSPTDGPVGSLIRIGASGVDTIMSGLRRPTSLLLLEGAGRYPEIVVTEYGKWSGRLSHVAWQANRGWVRSTLAEQTGALAVVRESDSTFLVLYGQGNERIARYARRGEGWHEATVTRFPPSYGSSSLSVIDWNGDDLPDLLYTNGDLADYISPPKPYQGIRILTGTPDGAYRMAEFIPFPGAYSAQLIDVEEDGEQEIAAISFFPNYAAEAPIAAAVFRRSADGWVASPLPSAATGRWLRLAAGDFDGDGDTDLAASALAMETYPDGGRLKSWVRNGLPFIVWLNRR